MNKIKLFVAKNQKLCEIVAAFLMTAAISYMLGITRSKEYFLALLIFVAILTVVRVGVKNYDKRRLKFSLWFAVPFGAALWFGGKLTLNSIEIAPVGVLDIPVIVALIVIFTFMMMSVLAFIDAKRFTPKKSAVLKNKKWWIFSLIIFLCWMPLFLVFFPGVVSVDSAVQIKQAIGEGVMSNWHPVLHTLLIAAPVNLGILISGDLTMGIALYTLMQMIILSIIFGYAVKWAMGKTQKNWVGYVMFAFFALCPVVACYAVTMWKDVLFSAVFMLMVMKIYDLLETRKRTDKISFKELLVVLALVFLVAFLRNGGVLVVVTLGVALLIYYKASRKMVGISFVVVTVLIMVVQGPIYKAFNISGSPFMESMSVPAQQIGYVTQLDELTEEEREKLEVYGDVEKLAESYTPMNADPAKTSFDYGKVEEDKVGFLKTWAELLTGHFGDFVKAYILQMHSYWYVQGDAWVLDFGHTHEELWLKTEYTDRSLLGEGTLELVQKAENGLATAVWSGWINNVGVLFWLMVVFVVVFLYQKRYYMLVPMVGIIIYMVSLLMASPVSWIFRYVYALLLATPILIVICFIKPKKGEK